MIRLAPTFHEKVWGTSDIAPWFAARPGKTGEVWFEHVPRLPILIKFLFTSESLSVQVHPPDRGGEPGKTEMWHILRARPEARIALGFRQEYSPERVRAAALSGELPDLLRWFPVRAGETYFAPAGAVHAIGAGVALCEIQQNSDITYRLFDYGRPRDLHLDAGLEVARLAPAPGPENPVTLGAGRSLLVECPYFRTELLEFDSRCEAAPGGAAGLFTVLEGSGSFGTADSPEKREFGPGEVWLSEGEPVIPCPHGRTRLLRSFQPAV